MARGKLDEQNTRFWSVLVLVSLITNFALGLGLVWFNTQHTNMGYELKRLAEEKNRVVSHSAKLKVERDLLLSPYNLEIKAREMGLRTALPGQIRRLD